MFKISFEEAKISGFFIVHKIYIQQMDAPNEPPVDNPLPNGNRGRNRPDLTNTVTLKAYLFNLKSCSVCLR